MVFHHVFVSVFFSFYRERDKLSIIILFFITIAIIIIRIRIMRSEKNKTKRCNKNEIIMNTLWWWWQDKHMHNVQFLLLRWRIHSLTHCNRRFVRSFVGCYEYYQKYRSKASLNWIFIFFFIYFARWNTVEKFTSKISDDS